MRTAISISASSTASAVERARRAYEVLTEHRSDVPELLDLVLAILEE